VSVCLCVSIFVCVRGSGYVHGIVCVSLVTPRLFKCCLNVALQLVHCLNIAYFLLTTAYIFSTVQDCTLMYCTVRYGTVVENPTIPWIIMKNHNKSHKT